MLQSLNVMRSLVKAVRWSGQCFATKSNDPAVPARITAAVDAANREIAEFFGIESADNIRKEPRQRYDSPDASTIEQKALATARASEIEDQSSPRLTHVDASGSATMIDTSNKENTFREAGASVRVFLGREAFSKVLHNQLQKGDVLTVSKIAGIQAAKQTASLLPLCHPIPLSHVDAAFELNADRHEVVIRTTAKCTFGTGVEMEALTAAAVAALNVIDMVKAVTKSAVITDLQLMFKHGGKSGSYEHRDV